MKKKEIINPLYTQGLFGNDKSGFLKEKETWFIVGAESREAWADKLEYDRPPDTLEELSLSESPFTTFEETLNV